VGLFCEAEKGDGYDEASKLCPSLDM
jgi:hypothetical protein